jgi:hypothetical protein
MRLSIHEILDKAAQAKTRAEKIAILQANRTPVLLNILQLAFSKTYEWDLPEGTPPLARQERNLPMGISDTNMYREARTLYLYDKAWTKVPSRRKETLFINLLEGLHYTEADMLLSIKDHTFTKRYPGITLAVVQEAFPGDNIG